MTDVRKAASNAEVGDALWPDRLKLRDTAIYADEGQRIYTTATGYGYPKKEYVRADLVTVPNATPVAWLREFDAGTDNACLVISAKGDPEAFPVFRAPQAQGDGVEAALAAITGIFSTIATASQNCIKAAGQKTVNDLAGVGLICIDRLRAALAPKGGAPAADLRAGPVGLAAESIAAMVEEWHSTPRAERQYRHIPASVIAKRLSRFLPAQAAPVAKPLMLDEMVVEILQRGVRTLSRTAEEGSQEVRDFMAFGDSTIANEGDVHAMNYAAREVLSALSGAAPQAGEARAITDEMISQAEMTLSRVLFDQHYVMPEDGMRRVLSSALNAGWDEALSQAEGGAE